MTTGVMAIAPSARNTTSEDTRRATTNVTGAQRFADAFDIIADSERGPTRLRRLVLELAIRGQLSTPLPDDRSAAELLESARHHRETLIRNGEIRQGEEVGLVEDEDAPFPLPSSNWAWTRIGLAMHLVNGRAFKATEWSKSGLPIVRIQNLNNRDAPFNYCSLPVERKFHLQPGDFLISWSGTPGTSFGAFIWDGPAGLVNQHIFRAELFGAAYDPRFLRIAINARLDEMIAQAHGGVGLQHITKGKLEALVIPLPPLTEQKRIVAKVDELMRRLDDFEVKQTEQRATQSRFRVAALDALTSTEGSAALATSWSRVLQHFEVLFERPESPADLRRAILELAVRGRVAGQNEGDEPVQVLWNRIQSERAHLLKGRRVGGRGRDSDLDRELVEPYAIPAGWLWCRLADVAGHIVDGTHHTPKYQASGVAFISAKDIQGGSVSFQNCKYISPGEFAELAQRCRPQPGNVLVTKSGSIGDVAVVDTDRPFTLFESVALIPVVPSIDPEFAAYVVYLGASGQFGRDNQKGVAVRHLHLVDLRRLPFPLPPLAEQHRIVAAVQHLMNLCDDLETKLRRADATAGALVSAVVGEVVAA